MASLHAETFVSASADEVWAAVADVGALHTRLVPGFVTDCHMDGDTRIVTFANGMVVREPIVSVDHDRRRLAWTSEGGRAKHYNAVLEVLAEGSGCRVRWTIDLLPNELAAAIGAMQKQGLETLRKTLSR